MNLCQLQQKYKWTESRGCLLELTDLHESLVKQVPGNVDYCYQL